MGYIQAKNRGSHAKEGLKDIEKYSIQNLKFVQLSSSSENQSDPIPAQGQRTYWLVENIHN